MLLKYKEKLYLSLFILLFLFFLLSFNFVDARIFQENNSYYAELDLKENWNLRNSANGAANTRFIKKQRNKQNKKRHTVWRFFLRINIQAKKINTKFKISRSK